MREIKTVQNRNDVMKFCLDEVEVSYELFDEVKNAA